MDHGWEGSAGDFAVAMFGVWRVQWLSAKSWGLGLRHLPSLPLDAAQAVGFGADRALYCVAWQRERPRIQDTLLGNSPLAKLVWCCVTNSSSESGRLGGAWEGRSGLGGIRHYFYGCTGWEHCENRGDISSLDVVEGRPHSSASRSVRVRVRVRATATERAGETEGWLANQLGAGSSGTGRGRAIFTRPT